MALMDTKRVELKEVEGIPSAGEVVVTLAVEVNMDEVGYVLITRIVEDKSDVEVPLNVLVTGNFD